MLRNKVQLIIRENKFSQLLKAETMCYMVNTFPVILTEYLGVEIKIVTRKYLIAEFIDTPDKP